jgi:hypothetical protein
LRQTVWCDRLRNTLNDIRTSFRIAPGPPPPPAIQPVAESKAIS